MEWKAAIMLCLLFFATTLVTTITATSFGSPSNILNNIIDSASLNISFDIKPLGDPVDNDVAPN